MTEQTSTVIRYHENIVRIAVPRTVVPESGKKCLFPTRISNLRLYPSCPHFIARPSITSAVHQAITSEGYVMLSGGVGSGKTQVSLEYARLHEDEYEITWFINTQSLRSLQHAFQRGWDLIQSRASVPSSVSPASMLSFDLVTDVLRLFDHPLCGPALVVLDEITSSSSSSSLGSSSLQNYLQSPWRRCRVVGNTRTKPKLDTHVVEIPGFTSSEARLYLSSFPCMRWAVQSHHQVLLAEPVMPASLARIVSLCRVVGADKVLDPFCNANASSIHDISALTSALIEVSNLDLLFLGKKNEQHSIASLSGSEPSMERLLLLENVAALSVSGDSLFTQQKFQQAVDKYQEILELLEQDMPHMASDVVVVLIRQSLCLEHMRQASKAIALLERVRNIEQQVGVCFTQGQGVMTRLGSLYIEIGDVGKAVDTYHAALAESILQPEGPSLSIDLHNLGAALYRSGKEEEAKQMLLQAACINERLSLVSASAANTLAILGLISFNARDFQKSLEFNERAYSIEVKIHGPHHKDTATSLFCVCHAKHALGQASLEEVQQVVNLFQLLDLKTDDAVRSLLLLGEKFVDRDELETGQKHIDEGLAMMRVIGSPTDDLAATLYQMASVLLSKNQQQAARYLEESVTLYRELSPTVTSYYAFSTLALMLIQSGEIERAVALHADGMTSLVAVYGDPHQRLAIALDKAASEFYKQGFISQAIHHLKLAVDIHRRLGEGEGQSTANDFAHVLITLGLLEHDQKNGAEAEKLLFEAFLVGEGVIHGDDNDRVESMQNLSDLQAIQENSKDEEQTEQKEDYFVERSMGLLLLLLLGQTSKQEVDSNTTPRRQSDQSRDSHHIFHIASSLIMVSSSIFNSHSIHILISQTSQQDAESDIYSEAMDLLIEAMGSDSIIVHQLHKRMEELA